MWIPPLDMSTKYQGEPMQISWNLCLIQTKFIKIEIQEDSMCFKSSFFPYYFKNFVTRKSQGGETKI